jgi:uncharacterized membrane protein YphA (DoxX/SURF4 family)
MQARNHEARGFLNFLLFQRGVSTVKKQASIRFIKRLQGNAAAYLAKLILILTLLAVALIVSGLIDF